MPAIRGLKDGPSDVDPAFYDMWARSNMTRRYLAHWPDEVPRVYRMLDLVARGAGGHGPVHLLLASAAEIGFAWDGREQGWLKVALHPLRMLAGLVHFRSAVLRAWQLTVTTQLAQRKGFWCSVRLYQRLFTTYLSSPAREKDIMLLRAILSEEVSGTDPSWPCPKGRCPLQVLWW